MSLQELQEQVRQLSMSDRIGGFRLYVGTGAIASINPHNPFLKLSQL